MRVSLGHLAIVAAAFGCARAPATEDARPPPIRPTVTAQSGDSGGLFFGQKPEPEKTRHYFIAAEAEPWDFVPAGRDEVCGLVLPPALVAHAVREKLRYIQYTDATFTTRVPQNPSLGLLGPVLRGVVGEFLAVTFFNRTTQPLSMHPHGVHYDKDSEGAYYEPNPGRGAAVAPGAKFTYVWQLDEQSGPAPDEPSSKGWLYHSHVRGDTETNLGLIGSIIVTDPKRARPDGTPVDVDREFATLFMIFDESGPDPLPAAGPPAALTWAQTQERVELGGRYAINGRVFGNLRGLDMNEGERTRWYLFALGSVTDFHTAHWHGLRVVEEGRRRTDVVELLPATMKVADLLADNPGSWLFHCHVAEHMREGMFARLTIYEHGTVGVSRAPAVAFLGVPAPAPHVAVVQRPSRVQSR
jgi:FtsP/CotA-like multicopper oxidase with cupredoxin domain